MAARPGWAHPRRRPARGHLLRRHAPPPRPRRRPGARPRRSSSSTSPPRASIRSAARPSGRRSASSTTTAPRSSSPPSTWRRPTSSQTASGSSPAAASSPRAPRGRSRRRSAGRTWSSRWSSRPGRRQRAEVVLARFGRPLPAKDGTLMVELEHGTSEVGPIVVALNKEGLDVESLDLVQPTLDDVFVREDGTAPRGLRGEESRGATRLCRSRQSSDRPAGDECAGGPGTGTTLGQANPSPPSARCAARDLPHGCCSRSRPAGAGRAVDLPGFPPVANFLASCWPGRSSSRC